jgi:hypothetical protein
VTAATAAAATAAAAAAAAMAGGGGGGGDVTSVVLFMLMHYKNRRCALHVTMYVCLFAYGISTTTGNDRDSRFPNVSEYPS